MNFLKTSDNRNPAKNEVHWTSNLLSNEAIILIHSANEAIQEYRSNYEILKRRQIAFQVKQLLELFVNYPFKKDERDFFIELLERNYGELKKLGTNIKTKIDLLEKIDPTGIEILEIGKEINLEELKKLYRKAAKKYHPDFGGSHQKMLRVNEVYALYHSALNSFVFYEQSGTRTYKKYEAPQSWDDLIFAAYLLLACINGDFYASDKALPYLIKAYDIALDNSSEFVNSIIRDLSEIGGVINSTVSVLGKFKLEDEYIKARIITSYLTDRLYGTKHHIDEDVIRYRIKSSSNGRNYLTDFGTRLVINHPERAKNAFRLGKIDEKRYKSVMQRFKTREFEEDIIIKRIDEFVREYTFIQELSNSDYSINLPVSQVINFPSIYQKRFKDLNNNQKWEYLKAYSPKGSGKLIRKYYKIRCQEILLGLIENYEKIDVLHLKKEIDYFCSLSEEFDGYLLLSESLDYLMNLELNERSEKLKLLKQLDDPEPNDFDMDISIPISIGTDNVRSKKIEFDYDYISFLKMDLDEIMVFKNTGYDFSDYSQAWERDIKELRNFENSDVGKKRQLFWIEKLDANPNEIVESSRPYIEGLLNLGKKFHPKNTGELQIGFEINRLTTAFAKLKQWSEVIYWGELFFRLPLAYRDRSPDGEQNQILRRIMRAKGMQT